MKIGHIELLVKDVASAKQFYENVLGFTVTVVQNDQFVWLRNGDIEILLRPGTPPKAVDSYSQAPIGFVLYTDNLDRKLQVLKKRGLVVRGTVDSDRCYTFTDPDGNWFQLVDPGDH